MLDYQRHAINEVRRRSIEAQKEKQLKIQSLLDPIHRESKQLMQELLARPITINFHPDRLTNQGESVIQGLLKEGKYESQFKTGTTSGDKTAYVGGRRFEWEQNLFFNTYPHEAIERPKYGALNIFNYQDGAAMRFGSCYFTLKPSILDRCTFTYGDSSNEVRGLCTSDTFESILYELLVEIDEHKRVLNQITSSFREGVATLLFDWKPLEIMGRNLDYYIEVHIHGTIDLLEDVAYFHMDESFKGTSIEKQAKLLCDRYQIALKYIPTREVSSEKIDDLFRGEDLVTFVRHINERYQCNQSQINARLIGEVAKDVIENSGYWSRIGTEEECFQWIKQLWHTVGYFG